MRGHLTVFALALLVSMSVSQATAETTERNLVVYVDASAGGANDGSSWENAYNDLQDALDSENTPAPAEIWVAAGVYKPVEPEVFGSPTIDERDETFHLRNGITIYGGFSGNEAQLDQRDWRENLTVLSGDIANSSDADVNGIVADPSGLGGGNSFSILKGTDTASNAVLDGFVVTGGWANSDGICTSIVSNRHGAGIHSESGNPTIKNTTFVGNEARCNGGAVFNTGDSRPTFIDVRITSNAARIGSGGGIFSSSSSPELMRVEISGNTAGQRGGGIWTSGSLELVDAVLSDNHASGRGGALYFSAGTMALTNALVSGNLASQGGGVFHGGDSSILTNAVVVSNRATSTISGSSGGIASATNAQIRNSIIWGNQRGLVVGSADSSFTGSPIVRYSLIQGHSPEGDGNFDCSESCPDPRFVETLDSNLAPSSSGNFRLQSGSPAIDAGNNDFVEVDFDLDGLTRIQNGIVDLGPYESVGPVFHDRFEQ